MLRHLILSFVLLTNTLFAQPAGLNSSRFDATYQRLTDTTFAQDEALNSSGFDRNYKLTLRNPVQDKNFYLLSLFQRHPEVRKLLRANKALKRLSDEKLQASRVAADCNDVGCFNRLLRFSGPTIEMVATELEGLAERP